MATTDESASTGPLAMLQRAASIGTVVKTLIGLVAGLVVASTAVYQHFAKTSELRALQCAVVDQSNINNQVVRTAQEVRTALSVLKQNLDTPPGQVASSKAIADELSKAIGNIQSALDKIEEARARIQSESIKGERKC